VEPMPARRESDGAAEVIHEDIGVHEDVSHGSTRRGRGQQHPGRRRR
jgi:hypothetical protein